MSLDSVPLVLQDNGGSLRRGEVPPHDVLGNDKRNGIVPRRGLSAPGRRAGREEGNVPLMWPGLMASHGEGDSGT